MLHNSTTKKQVENQGKNTYGIDFLCKQIKELWDQIEKHQESVWNLAESRAIVKGFIIEKKNKEWFILFKNDKIFITATDFSTTWKEALELEIQIKSPIINKKYPSNVETKRIDLNVSEIEDFIKESLKKIELKEIAIKNNYNIIEGNVNWEAKQDERESLDGETTLRQEKIEKRIYFGWWWEDSIALLRAETLKLYENKKILTVKQINLNTYTIVCQNVQFTINIVANQLIINGNLEDIIEIEKIYPIINEIIEKNKELFIGKDSSDIKEESSGWIKKLFGFGKGKEKQSIVDFSYKNLDETIRQIWERVNALAKFKSNLEMWFLDDLDEFDYDIREDIKDISIVLIDEILEWVEKISENPDSKQVLYIYHLLQIFRLSIRNNNRNLTILYDYILSKKSLKSKYGKKIKEKILETKEYESNLFYQLTSCWDTSYYKTTTKENHDMIFSEDSMQVIFTSQKYNIVSYNTILRKKEAIVKQRKCTYQKMSSDGKYLFFERNGLVMNKNIISDLQENKEFRPNDEFDNNREHKHIMHNHFLLDIDYTNSISEFQVYNIKNNTTKKVSIPMDENTYCITGNVMNFFEVSVEWYWNSKKYNFVNLNSYNLSNGEMKSLSYLVNPGDKPIDVCSNDNNFYLILKDKDNKLILRSVKTKDWIIDNATPIDYDISCFNHVFQKKHIHISNDGYILLQDKNDIYIVDINHEHKIYKITPKEKLNDIFKVCFVNSPQYWHFAVCRDGNQIHKIDIQLIEELVTPVYLDQVNKELEERRERKKELDKKSEEDKKIKEEEEVELDKEKTTAWWNYKEIDKEDLKTMGNSELQMEMVAELRETRQINTMILEKLEESNKINASMAKTINQLKEILSEKK